MSSQSITNTGQDYSFPTETAYGTSGRSRLRSMTGVQVLATGSYVPQHVVSNEDLAEVGYDSEWIIQRTGIESRHRAADDVATSDLAFEAAQRCLDESDVDPMDVDMILVATMTPDSPIPSTACRLQERLGLSAAAMDVNAACAGFMFALVTAAQFVKAGGARLPLVVGADTNTRIVNPLDPKTFPLFGDGAGAVLLGPGSEQQGLLSYTLGSEGEGAELLRIPAGGSRCPMTPQRLAEGEQFIQMDGRPVFKWAVRLLGDTIRDVLLHAQLTMDDISMVVLHQANIRIMEAAAEDLGIPRSKLLVNVNRFGNTSAGSIPLGLDEARRDGRIGSGDKVLMCGFGAGLAWGAAVVQL